VVQNRQTPCCWFLCRFSSLQTEFEKSTGFKLGGALDDLQEDAGAISGLNSVSSPFPMHFIVGVSSPADESLLTESPDQTGHQGLIDAVRQCNPQILPSDIRTVFHGGDSDLVVSVLSQRRNLNEGSNGTTNTSALGSSINTPAVVLEGQNGFSLPELRFSLLVDAGVRVLNIGLFVIP
jgi:hypothetical protein